MSDLSRKIQARTEQNRAEIEKLISDELQSLSESLSESAQNALTTTEAAIRAEAKRITKQISNELQQIERQYRSRGRKTAGILTGILLGICAVSWGTVLFQSWLTDRDLAAKQAAIRAMDETLTRSKAWGLVLSESGGEKFLVLPPGLTLQTGFSSGKSEAAKIVKK